MKSSLRSLSGGSIEADAVISPSTGADAR